MVDTSEWPDPKSRTPKVFDWTITFGNLLTILVFIAGGIIGYVRLEQRVNAMAIELAEHKTEQTALMHEYVRRDVQDTRNSFIDKQLAEMKDLLQKILTEVKMR